MGKIGFRNVVYWYTTVIAGCIWLLVGRPVRSLKSHKEALKKALLWEEYNDLTSLTSNKILGIHIYMSVVAYTKLLIVR